MNVTNVNGGIGLYGVKFSFASHEHENWDGCCDSMVMLLLIFLCNNHGFN